MGTPSQANLSKPGQAQPAKESRPRRTSEAQSGRQSLACQTKPGLPGKAGRSKSRQENPSKVKPSPPGKACQSKSHWQVCPADSVQSLVWLAKPKLPKGKHVRQC